MANSEPPSTGLLWKQSGGDPGRYRELLTEHGYIVQCECPCHPAGQGHCEQCKPQLPCGYSPDVSGADDGRGHITSDADPGL